MSLFRVLFTALLAAVAVVMGLFVSVGIALVGAVYFFGRRLLGNKTRPGPQLGPRPRRREVRADPDAIDVTATEVKSDATLR